MNFSRFSRAARREFSRYAGFAAAAVSVLLAGPRLIADDQPPRNVQRFSALQSI
jgi:hypothetical protein